MFNRINGYFEQINENKYLTLVSANESEEKIKNHEELCNEFGKKIKISSKTNLIVNQYIMRNI